MNRVTREHSRAQRTYPKMVGNLGRNFWIIESSQYEFSIVMIREICSGLLEELKSGLGKVFIR